MPPDEPAATTDQAVSVPGETDPLSSNLKHASTFYIAQRIELCEIFTGCEMLNKYDFYNEHNELFLKATEDSDFCTRQCCGQNRPLDILFTDASQTREIMRMERPCSCLTDRLSVMMGLAPLSHFSLFFFSFSSFFSHPFLPPAGVLPRREARRGSPGGNLLPLPPEVPDPRRRRRGSPLLRVPLRLRHVHAVPLLQGHTHKGK